MSDLQPHFEDGMWIDFVRGLAPIEAARQLEAHLEAACPECVETHAAWSRILDLTRRELSYRVPEDTVRVVHAAFALRHKTPMLARLAQAAVRIFDSFEEPLPAGIRGGPTSARQLLHTAGNFLIDLRLEPEGRVEHLTGQILSTGAEDVTSGAGVVLVHGKEKLVAQTIANSFGEFQMEFERQNELQLYVETTSNEIIAVGLPDANPSAD